MSLVTQLSSAFTSVATDVKRLRTYITGSSTGDLTGLTTTNKTSIIAAINEVKASGGTVTGAMVFKGVIDCSANPNYPAANRGDTYKVSVAGKIGGASGSVVEAGDLIMCITDSTAAGTQAAVGAQWVIEQTNIDGAVVGPTSAVSANIATFSGTTGKLIQDSGLSLDTTTTLGTSNTKVPSQNAVKVYADAAQAAAAAASQPLDSDLTAIAALATQTFGRSLLTSVDAAAARTTLGLGTAATTAASAYDAAGAATAAQAASQPLDSDLTAIAALTTAAFGRSLLTAVDAAAVRTSISTYSQTELGDPTTDFATAYSAATV